MFYWLMKYVVIGPIVKAIFRPWIVGRRNIPKTGAAILASNHLSFADSIFLPLMIDRPVTFLAKSDYFTGKGIKGWATRVFFKVDARDRLWIEAESSRSSGTIHAQLSEIWKLAARRELGKQADVIGV